jgi:hypothetical protein
VGVEVPGEALDRARLGEARQALDQQVAIREQPEQQALDQLLLADDRSRHVLLQLEDDITRAHALLLQSGRLTALIAERSHARRTSVCAFVINPG